jgi:enediyne biosynthesis protein E4
MTTSRRVFLAGLMGATATACLGQGVTPHKAAALPRSKPSGLPFNCSFTDVAPKAGLNAITVYGESDRKEYIVETLGCGCAFFDFDNDGWLDIFLLSGTRFTNAPAGASNRLFKNHRDGTFTDVTEHAGLSKSGWACGVCVGDYNNDGFEDLFVTYWGQNVLYRNNGDGTFTDVTRAAGLSDSANRWGSGCTFLDYDRDGHLDLFVANYLDFDLQKAPKPGQNANCRWLGAPVTCGPRGFPYGHHSLYRNKGDGTFADVSVASGVASAKSSYGLTPVAGDFDDDGWPDIYLACDSTPSLLFMNNRDGTFREEGAIRGVAYGEDGQEQAGMGAAVNDYDLDGRLDIFKTNFEGDTPDLYRNMGKANFEEASRKAGLAVENRFVCWGAGMADLDNNGLPDLFMVAGHTFPEIEKHNPAFPAKDPRMLFRNLGEGRFEELVDQAGSVIQEPHNSRGCAFGDIDNDGDLDILIINLNEPPSLIRNDVTGSNSWLKVKLIGTKSNRSAIGGRVVVSAGGSTQTQEVQSQSSFLSCNDFRLHFGLGGNKSAEVKIRWPSGEWQTLTNVTANQLITVKEGSGIVPSLGWPKR